LLQAAIKRASAQTEGLCRFPSIAIISSERLFDEKRLHFFKTHVLNIARFGGTGCETQIGCADLSILRHQHSAFDDVIELSNISRKPMLQQAFSCHFIETANLFPITLCVLTKETVGKRYDVFPSVAQRRQRNLDCIKAKQEVLPKTSGRDFVL
jgi:hypothetical protein